MSTRSAIDDMLFERTIDRIRDTCDQHGYGYLAGIAFPPLGQRIDTGYVPETNADSVRRSQCIRSVRAIAREQIFAAFDKQRVVCAEGGTEVTSYPTPPRPGCEWPDIRAQFRRASDDDLSSALAEAIQEEYVRR